ncbi:MAG TPA: hypothetical protein VF556_09710 [Pyrinomonadaceae bacterium]
MSSLKIIKSNPFGYYRFVNVPAIWNYQATIAAKNRNFSSSTISLIPTNDVTNLNFIGAQ